MVAAAYNHPGVLAKSNLLWKDFDRVTRGEGTNIGGIVELV